MRVALSHQPPSNLQAAGPPIQYWQSNATNPCAAHPKWRPDSAVREKYDLTGRVVVVTGASSGIGRAVAAALEAEGATVLGTSRTPAHPLLRLDMADPASVASFAASVAAHPAVVARGGIDALVNNAGRTVLGSPGPPPSILNYTSWVDGLRAGIQTNYVGTVRVTNALWPLLESRSKHGGDGYARVVTTVSPLAWATGGGFEPYLFGYTASQRALLGYCNNLRAAATTVGSKVALSTLAPMATATALATGRRPIFLQPTTLGGDAAGDPAFQAFIDAYRAALTDGADPATIAAAYVQILKEDKPVANAAVGSPGVADTIAPQQASPPFASVLTAEALSVSAFVPVPPKPAVAIITGLPDKVAAGGDDGGGRRRLMSTLKDDAEGWVAHHRTPCTPLPLFYPTRPSKKEADPAFTANLTGMVAVVTGASGRKGVGGSLADALTAAGVTVIGTSRTPAAYAEDLPYDLTTLDMAHQASVDAFGVYLSTHPAVIARGGVDFAVLNAGRFALGSPGPPPLLDEGLYYESIDAALATNYLGPLRVVATVWPFLEARAAAAGRGGGGGGGPPPPPAGRLIFTASASAYATGGGDPLSYFYWAYAASKRASLSYYDALRGVLEKSGNATTTTITTATVHPMAVNTRLAEGTRPAFLQPVDAAGIPVGDLRFKAIMALYRDGLSRALDPAFVADADLQLLLEEMPPPDVVAGGWGLFPLDEGRIGGQQDTWDIISQVEGLQSAFPFEAGK